MASTPARNATRVTPALIPKVVAATSTSTVPSRACVTPESWQYAGSVNRPTPQPRSVVADIPTYRAGKPADDDTHKLASNENPLEPLPTVRQRITEALGRVNRYPDASCSQLYAALARQLDVPAHWLIAGTGSVHVLYGLLCAWCESGDEVVYAWRSFEAYPIAVALSGATGVPVPLTDGRHDLEAMRAAVTERTKVVLVCTPNNPTGPAVDHDDLAAFIASVPGDVLVVIDEAYGEFVRGPRAARGLDLVREHRNVVVLRTFSKAYGLAGLRVGYAIAHPLVIEHLAKAIAPFSVSSIAQEAAIASLDAQNELAARVDGIVAERERVIGQLRDQGWPIPDSEGNFVWVPAGGESARIATELSPLSVRLFDDEGIRVTIGTPQINAQFVDLMRAIGS